MKRILLIAIFALVVAMNGKAQRLQVIDANGTPVPYASVLNTNAEYIGITDLEGVVPDVKGAKDIIITHVAFKTKNVKPLGKDMVVILEEADFELPEITITKKEYTYLQVYYRIVAISKSGVLFYRAGLVDNFYNEEKRKQESSKQHITKAKSGTVKTVGNLIMNFIVDAKATIRTKTEEERMLQKYKDLGLKIVSEGSSRKRIIDNYGTLGSIIDQNGQRRITIDETLAYLHYLEAENKTRELKKVEKRKAKVENAVSNSYCVFSIDDNGNYRPEDFLLEQHLYSGDYEKHGHCIFIMDFFATNRGYYSKEGMKQVKKNIKVKMTYDWTRQFEHDHAIPAFVPAVQQKVDELWRKAGD